jgi:putative MATE family efflux protein
MTDVKRRIGARRGDVDMTVGSPMKHILYFAAPTLVGNIFQQLYNTVDAWVVGNYVSQEALAAVGSVGSVINLLVGLFLGFSMGAGVIISQYYGRGDLSAVRRTVTVAMISTAILCVAVTALGIFMAPTILRLMKTPDDVFPISCEYLTIYFAGVSGLMIYNIGSGILRAIGDSKRPFYYLVVSAVINTVLDLWFVIVLNMGVAGVAIATVIAQGASALLIITTLLLTRSSVRLDLSDVRGTFAAPRRSLSTLGEICRVGMPSAIQLALTAFSNIFVQSYINDFGKEFMSAWTAYSKIDQFILLPMQSISVASTTFVGQNLGAGNVDRAKRGVRTSLVLGFISTTVIMLPIMIFAPQLVLLFIDEPTALGAGAILLRLISPFYLAWCVYQMFSGALRGSGNTRAVMIISLATFVAFRQVYLFAVSSIFPGNEWAIALAYPIGWLAAAIVVGIYYRRCDLTRHIAR